MNPEVQAAIIRVAGEWTLAGSKYVKHENLGPWLLKSFNTMYEELIAIVMKTPNS
jgi:hypothetical protein